MQCNQKYSKQSEMSRWVPYVLNFQALFIRLPLSFWPFGRRISDSDFDYVNELGMKARTAEKRKAFLSEAANYICQVVKARKTLNGLGSLVGYMNLLYKVINVFVVFAQIYMLKVFVGYNSWTWGVKLLSQNWSHVGETSLIYFPRVAYYQFDRDFLGQPFAGIHQEARCTLGINMLNEKVFMFLFLWYHLFCLLVLSNAIIHAQRLLSAYRVSSVRRLLSFGTVEDKKNVRNTVGRGPPAEAASAAITRPDVSIVSRFVDECLGQDGCLMVHFVSQNAGKLVASELTVELFALMTAFE